MVFPDDDEEEDEGGEGEDNRASTRNNPNAASSTSLDTQTAVIGGKKDRQGNAAVHITSISPVLFSNDDMSTSISTPPPPLLLLVVVVVVVVVMKVFDNNTVRLLSAHAFDGTLPSSNTVSKGGITRCQLCSTSFGGMYFTTKYKTDGTYTLSCQGFDDTSLNEYGFLVEGRIAARPAGVIVDGREVKRGFTYVVKSDVRADGDVRVGC